MQLSNLKIAFSIWIEKGVLETEPLFCEDIIFYDSSTNVHFLLIYVKKKCKFALEKFSSGEEWRLFCCRNGIF